MAAISPIKWPGAEKMQSDAKSEMSQEKKKRKNAEKKYFFLVL